MSRRVATHVLKTEHCLQVSLVAQIATVYGSYPLESSSHIFGSSYKLVCLIQLHSILETTPVYGM